MPGKQEGSSRPWTELDGELAFLPQMTMRELRERWMELGDGAAPTLPEPLLRRLLAHRLQEQRYGGLPVFVQRELARAGKGAHAAAATASSSSLATPSLAPGTRLIREWNGQTIVVQVLDDGFAWENRHYRSLSQIAREVTGARWSGPRFFGLTHGG